METSIFVIASFFLMIFIVMYVVITNIINKDEWTVEHEEKKKPMKPKKPKQ